MRTLYKCVCMCMFVIIQLIIYCQLQRIKLFVLVGNRTIARCEVIGQMLSTVPDAMQLQHQGVRRILRKILLGTPRAPGARGTRLYSQPLPLQCLDTSREQSC